MIFDKPHDLAILNDELLAAGVHALVENTHDGKIRVTGGDEATVQAVVEAHDAERARAIREKLAEIDAEAEAHSVERKRDAAKAKVRALTAAADVRSYKVNW